MKRWQPIPFVLVLALSGCAASSEKVADRSSEGVGRVCVGVRNITSFDAIDDRHIYVKATGPHKHLLFTVDGGCIGLQSAHTIAVKDAFTRVCSDSFGEVIYRDLGRGLQSCRIRVIEEAASKDDAERMVEDRKAEKRDKQSDD